jgi:predicted Zn-dependent protease with MMP-like domain
LKEVGEHFGLHDAQVSRIVRRVKSAESNARP